MRKRLTETEMKSARTVHQLNKEIGELETLIESKVMLSPLSELIFTHHEIIPHSADLSGGTST